MASRPYPPSRPMTGEQAGLPRAGGQVDGRQSASAGRRRAAALPPWPIAAVVILGALLTGLTGILSLVAPATFLTLTGHPGEPLTTGVMVFADYAGAREIAIAAALLVLLALRSQRVLPAL